MTTRTSWLPKRRPMASNVLYYPMINDAYSTTIKDWSSGNNPGTMVGATWDRIAKGVQTSRYDGNDYVNIDVAVNDLAATTKGTWMLWIKLDTAIPLSSAYIMTFGDTNASELIGLVIRAGAGKFEATLTDGGIRQWALATDAQALSNGIWGHLALIQNGIAPVLVVNGVQVAQTFIDETDDTAWFSDCAGLDNGRIGCLNYNGAGNGFFIVNGNIDIVDIENTNLAVSQVKGIYDVERHLFGV